MEELEFVSTYSTTVEHLLYQMHLTYLMYNNAIFFLKIVTVEQQLAPFLNPNCLLFTSICLPKMDNKIIQNLKMFKELMTGR